ncbi:EamA family transporter RarD [Photobacterium sp. GJ3]|uniref:EamA family transporter RarD n=1 Tax=Photobacterium sp. GJ3 TaxID=2829502 RepID=UPI001B8ABCE8|nr:EamA family transporter RarD [Photobacterium sp. GJ3]QUJ66581.1 EamA family transporter RarD [Photobacterium sp. GJ3]
MGKGVFLSVLSSCLFGSMYYYATWMSPLDGEAIFSWRLLFTLPFLTVFLLVRKEWRQVREVMCMIRQRPLLWIGVPLSALLLGIQFWLFLWAPINGRALPVSLGYFMMPLVMVVMGRLIYQDRLSGLQKIAVGFAVFGVANKLWLSGGLYWETLVVAIGYPAYFMLRRQLKTDSLGGLWFDMALMIPPAFWWLFIEHESLSIFSAHPHLIGLILGLGILSAFAVGSYIVASRLLSFSLFGLLSYVEPVLLVIVSLLLGETIADGEWPTYLCIWVAVAFLMMDCVRQMLTQRQSVPSSVEKE